MQEGWGLVGVGGWGCDGARRLWVPGMVVVPSGLGSGVGRHTGSNAFAQSAAAHSVGHTPHLKGQVVLQRVCTADLVGQPRATHHHATAVLRGVLDAHSVLRGVMQGPCSRGDAGLSGLGRVPHRPASSAWVGSTGQHSDTRTRENRP